MLDLKLIRENPDFYKKKLSAKRVDPKTIDEIINLDSENRKLIQETDALKAKRNELNDLVSRLKRDAKDISKEIEEGKTLSHKIWSIDIKVGELEHLIETILLNIPNIIDDSVPVGKDASSNQVIREWGDKKIFSFKPKDHLVLANALGWLSMETGSKITGSAFPVYKGDGAKLERALINFMVDLHAKKHGYQQVWPPLLVNRASMTGTGQLPKFEEDMYRLKDDDLFLIPTAEVPVTNMHRDEVLNEKDLPVKYVAYTPCFRREAGSYGKDTKGLSRVHQFDKVELVKFVKPEDSLGELEKLVKDAEEILQLLEIPYRLLLLSSGDMSFAAAKCYDIEAWAPGTGRWFEVSSCSTFFDFQARRINVRFKPTDGGKPRFVHTLNGSGVALARTFLCLLENCQQQDGSIKFPKALEGYLS